MTDIVPGGILRPAKRIATTAAAVRWAIGLGIWLAVAVAADRSPTAVAVAQQPASDAAMGPPSATTVEQLHRFQWDFSRATDRDFDFKPDGWKQYRGIGYPSYIKSAIVARDAELERQLKGLDTRLLPLWLQLRKTLPRLPSLPPSMADAVVDRYLRIDLDGGQFKIQSPAQSANRIYQYRFSCQIMTDGLRHDTARAELVFLNAAGTEIAVHSTPPIGGTTDWATYQLDLVRPPRGATEMIARLIVDRAESGLEDIRGAIGFDDVRIDQYPQLQIFTDQPLGLYTLGQPVMANARIMGLPPGASQIQFQLFDSDDREVASDLQSILHQGQPVVGPAEPAPPADPVGVAVTDAEVQWQLPFVQPGFYRVAALIRGEQTSTLATKTTFAVIDPMLGGPPHGGFGWTLPAGSQGIAAKDLGPWLADLGVAWVKYPCWLAPDDTLAAEEAATVISKLQDLGIQTIGMLDVPPESQLSMYDLRGRRDLVAAQLFRDSTTWQPLLEPVMTRLSLKVRTWQLGADRDHSFLGRPRLPETITQISTGLQGFGQPIDVAISWPWLERELDAGESSWQAICRSSDPPLSASELDAFLSASATATRSDAPQTWLLLDPISRSQYDRDARIRDLVLRMATVRSHRVQAAFVSDPRHPDQGLLTANGRPDELLLPWRTTARMIGNLRQVGSLQLRSGAENRVFVGADRAVLMVWSAQPTEEQIYLGDRVQSVDVWGKVTELPVEPGETQPFQRVKIGPLPTFLMGVDPLLLAFRMSVKLEQRQLDSLIGQVQPLEVSFVNPMRESLVGEIRLMAPKSWSVESPNRSWESLPGRSNTQQFDVILNSTAEIGKYEVPIQFELDTVPPKLITVYRDLRVGPEGLDLKAATRLLDSSELRVQLEITNRSGQAQSYSCILFPPGGRQYQRRFVTINPGETIRREVYWPDGQELIGQTMLLRADEQDGRRRVLNYSIKLER